MTNMAAEKVEKAEKTAGRSAAGPAGIARQDGGGLVVGDHGQTRIADVVVQKIAALAAREMPGVRDLGGGTARTIGALRDRIPGAGTSQGQGVTVEVGERQVAVDLDVLVDFGAAIPELARVIRQNVIMTIEEMTGLEVVEVNISVVDVYLGDDSEAPAQQTRVE